MGSESSKSNSNCSKLDSELNSCNSGKKDEELETMECNPSNSNTIIKRTWIVKKPICLTDGHVRLFNLNIQIYLYLVKFFNKYPAPTILEPKKNIFNIKNNWNSHCKHWAIILELSNDSYINIQFGRNGFSLKEFNKTEIEGESI